MPKEPPFPINFFRREIDPSDPYLFLFLKRGILRACSVKLFCCHLLKLFETEYVQVKPVLAVITVILKAVGKYGEGNLTASSGYLWISIVYNTSICLSLYCLALFWICVNDDLKPFRSVFNAGKHDVVLTPLRQACTQVSLRQGNPLLFILAINRDIYTSGCWGYQVSGSLHRHRKNLYRSYRHPHLC